jgi:hypothetical protein
MKFAKATTFIEEICAKNPSKYAGFYLFQALALVREKFPCPADFTTVCQMSSSIKYWDANRIDINLMMLEIFFLKVSPE